jgi:hypothetical protein
MTNANLLHNGPTRSLSYLDRQGESDPSASTTLGGAGGTPPHTCAVSFSQIGSFLSDFITLVFLLHKFQCIYISRIILLNLGMTKMVEATTPARIIADDARAFLLYDLCSLIFLMSGGHTAILHSGAEGLSFFTPEEPQQYFHTKEN